MQRPPRRAGLDRRLAGRRSGRRHVEGGERGLVGGGHGSRRKDTLEVGRCDEGDHLRGGARGWVGWGFGEMQEAGVNWA